MIYLCSQRWGQGMRSNDEVKWWFNSGVYRYVRNLNDESWKDKKRGI